jgi:hypothetical protein
LSSRENSAGSKTKPPPSLAGVSHQLSAEAYGAEDEVAGTSTDIAGASLDDGASTETDIAGGSDDDGAALELTTADDEGASDEDGAAEEDDGAGASLELTAELDGVTGTTGVGVPRLKIQMRPMITITATMMIIQVLRFILLALFWRRRDREVCSV